MYYTFKVLDTSLDMEHIFELRYRVYCLEKQWLNPADYPGGLEQDRYDDFSFHTAAYDQKGIVAAYMRSILNTKLPGDLKLPITGHPAVLETDIQKNSLESSRLVVCEGHRNRIAALSLINIHYRFAVLNNFDYIYIVIEYPMYVMLRRNKYGFDQIGYRAHYMGETLAAVLDVRGNEEYLKKKGLHIVSPYTISDTYLLQ